jgi:hypothetical protein
MKALANVTDGADATALMREGAFNFLNALPLLALYLGIVVVGGGVLVAVCAALVVLGVSGLFASLPDREQQAAPGVWRVTNKGRWRRRLAGAVHFAGMGLALALAVVVSLRREPGWEGVYLVCTAAGFAVQAVLATKAATTPVDDAELRIDAQGVYARQLGGTLAWSEIRDVLPRRRGDRMRLRLAVGPNTLPLVPEGRRLHGGVVDLKLIDACVTREAALAVMTPYRSSSRADDVFVQPIEGVYVDQPLNTDAALGPVLVGVAIGAAIS